LLLPEDPQAARIWAEKAAGAGHPAAAARLGTMWHEATGGPRDPEQAVRWWRIAAKGGDADAAARLGAALHIGQGVPADQVEAMTWLLVGSSRHSPLVRPFFDRVRAGLTPAQFEAAEAMAKTALSAAPAADA
jgi:TPR repeat protein